MRRRSNRCTPSFHFPIPIDFFHSDYYNKAAPDTSWDYTDLRQYKEYTDNQDRIKTAQILHFNYWIDSLHFIDEDENLIYFNPKDTSIHLEFERISYDIVVIPSFISLPSNFDQAKQQIKSGYLDDLIANGTLPTQYIFTIGEFFNVNVADYYRNPEHIIEVPENTALIISDLVKNNPRFAIRTSYTKIKGQVRDKYPFPYIKARFDMVIRFEVEL